MTPEQSHSHEPPFNSPEAEHPSEERLYAWRKLAGYLTFDLIDEAFREKEELTIVDSCSAFPVYAEMTRAYLLQKVVDKGEKIMGKFFEQTQNRAELEQLLTEEEMAEFDTISNFINPEADEKTLSALKNIRSSVVPNRGSDFRKLVSSAIADLIHRPGKQLPTEEEIGQRLRQQHTYYKVEDQQIQAADSHGARPNNKKPVRIRTVFVVDAQVTPEQEIDTYLRDLRTDSSPESEEHRAKLKEIFFILLTKSIMKEIQDYHRDWQVVSLDMAEPENIKKQVRKSFSQDTLRSNLFQRSARIGEVGSHVRADAYKLPFRPGSVDFFTSIEGWPFYHIPVEADKTAWLAQEAATAQDVYDSLKPGATAVFFPWQSFDGESDHLEVIQRQWESAGASMEFSEVSRDKILELADKDENPKLTAHSPIFGDSNQSGYRVLRLQKPQT